MTSIDIYFSASAIIYDLNNQVLLAKRSSQKKLGANLWETIGGKMEKGETPEDAIKREITEELGNEVKIIKLQFFKEYFYETMERKLIFKVFLIQIEGNIQKLKLQK